ncbi:MAG TPA: S26 family signal peptidase [Tepidisphaeraceae bacterium]|nr:S26 family signal peptidase [Tepidisphaeraceae bacterium]
MQCSNCHFENMPGSAVCGRCGTSLTLEAAAIDVHPPRAGGGRKWLRRQLPLGRAALGGVRRFILATGAGVLHTVTVPTARQMLNALSLPRVAFGALWRSAIPGWSHCYLGLPKRGRWFLLAFLALLLPGLVFLGTGWGSFLIGLAFSVHSAAVLDVFNQAAQPTSVRRQLVQAFVVAILLFGVLYIPIGRFIGLFAEPQIIQLSMPPLQAGDVLLVNNLAYRGTGRPQPGDVVHYQSGNYQRRTPGPNGHGIINYYYQGPRIDRVIAGPGARVRWEAGWLTINGQRSVLRPLNPRMLPQRLEIEVPKDCYLIFATTTPNLGPTADAETWQALSCVPRENIQGRVYLRTHPLSRFGDL